MSKMYLLEPRVSEEDRLWAEEHHEVKRLNEQIEKSKKASKITACCGSVFLLAFMVLLIYCIIANDMENDSRILLLIYSGLMVLMFCILLLQSFGSIKTGNKRLITQKNIYIETLVEERNLNQENNLSKGETNE